MDQINSFLVFKYGLSTILLFTALFSSTNYIVRKHIKYWYDDKKSFSYKRELNTRLITFCTIFFSAVFNRIKYY